VKAATVPGGADPEAVEAALGVLGPAGRRDGPLGALTTYRVGGPAAVTATIRGSDDLSAVAAAVSASGLPVLVVGRGSNLLVADRGFGGIAVVLDASAYGTFEVPDPDPAPVVRAGAALPLPALARRSVDAGLSGLEWAVGVPGSVGGGVRMNAGGHGSDVAATVRACRVYDLAGPSPGPSTLAPAEMGLGYRRSSIGADRAVLGADFALSPGDPAAGRETIRDIVRWRREHQPGGQNAGSVFVNPMHTDAHAPADLTLPQPGPLDPAPPGSGTPSAGWLVEAAGLRGYRRASAAVSDKHANFIQADAGGSADDVYALLLELRAAVADRFGILLRTEVRLVGFPEPLPEGEG
jgi:UDP-N-acetylmuramate dehydrogenase